MTQAPVRTTRARLVGLDGLRGFLALCVILVHVTAHYSPSILKVTHVEVLGQAIVVFFVMSGMLIYMPFARAILDGSAPLRGLGGYVRARIFRVFPAYLLIFWVANLFGALYVENAMVVQARGGGGGTGSIFDPGALLLHLTLLQNYLPSQLQTGINSSWTLTVELAFYLMLPFLAALAAAAAARLAPRASRYAVAAAPGVLLILVGTVSRVVLALVAARSPLTPDMTEWGPNPIAVLTRSILPWSDNFGWGMLAIVFFLALRRGDLSIDRARTVRPVAWIVLAVAFVASSAFFFVAPRLIASAFAIFATALILLLIIPVDGTGRPLRVSGIVDNPVLHWLGTTSLSIYLWHYPVIIVLERWGLAGGDDWGGWIRSLMLVTVISVALASASFLLVERPAMRLGAGRKER